MIIIKLLKERLPFLILITGVGTYLSPIHLATAPWVPGLLLGIVIFFTGLSMDVSTIKKMKSKGKELFLAVSLKWVLTVTVSIGLAYFLFANHPEVAAGIIISGTVPSATAATLYTFLAGGNTSLVIVASFVDVGISPIITPISMLVLSGTTVSISFFNLLQSFTLIVLLPLCSGILIQKILPKKIHIVPSITQLGSSISLLLIIHTIVGSGKEAIRLELSLIPLIVLATIIQVTLPMFAAYLIARKMKMMEVDARAILFHVGLCNTALAAILAFEFIGEHAAIAPMVNMIVNLSIGSFVATRFARQTSP
ncbi:bile acid:sodium symporter family protein [Sutcliffiella rhizosphaerae]|uniref:Pantothenates transporter PanS n=1 Tax=Sutcliffiella rhizosphaerae TaxID=2880967 RepID=A0ABM8YS58_9BACI|nr:bile acid:sodium symporter [Sutcliffiella rhizosphaerae]CAG9622741.1 Pantothenate precursors transporter PanS [Sutcliffiella rhizosphaerae]